MNVGHCISFLIVEDKWKMCSNVAKYLNNLSSESFKVGLKIRKEKTKYLTNHVDSEDTCILTDQEKMEKVTEFKYLGQTTHLKDTTIDEIYARIRAAWSCFGNKTTNTSR